MHRCINSTISSQHKILPIITTQCPQDGCNGSNDAALIQLGVKDTPSPFATPYDSKHLYSLRISGYADTQANTIPIVFNLTVISIQRPALL